MKYPIEGGALPVVIVKMDAERTRIGKAGGRYDMLRRVNVQLKAGIAMKKLAIFILCIFVAPLLSACVVMPHPQKTETPSSFILPTATPKILPSSAPPSATPEQVPKFSADTVHPLLYHIGVALSHEHVTDFDAARGLDADRYFADALLYEFLNSDLYDESVQVGYNEHTYECVVKADDMLYLLHQYIGDYPALIQPPADIFMSQTGSGDYVYGRSDMGLTDYEIEVNSITSAYGGLIAVSAALYRLELDEDSDTPKVHVSYYKLYFIRADDSAYGYTITRCSIDVSKRTSSSHLLHFVKITKENSKVSLRKGSKTFFSYVRSQGVQVDKTRRRAESSDAPMD